MKRGCDSPCSRGAAWALRKPLKRSQQAFSTARTQLSLQERLVEAFSALSCGSRAWRIHTDAGRKASGKMQKSRAVEAFCVLGKSPPLASSVAVEQQCPGDSGSSS